MPRELESHEHPLTCDVGKEAGEMRVRAIEPCARDQDSVRLRAAAVGPARDQDMKLLGGVDADVNGEAAGVKVFLVGFHRAILGLEGEAVPARRRA
jgi:hypothetical protein